MTESDKPSPPGSAPTTPFRFLAARAARAGYRLVRGDAPPHPWLLLDAEDGQPLHTATSLDQIQQWLNS
ncbi:hypothetical protein BJY24_007639 [Nocardia transvalensis]|uniref:Uncharacterized protein n=1 Tax=Nocardia transvalensis TaxID=37333 RepID=A0A7W9PMC2_9NOCA|nr:hypothetical protein [Nocardia transvalensis]MBB5918727.1 hypothetical protein [Nocardia transvalensis]